MLKREVSKSGDNVRERVSASLQQRSRNEVEWFIGNGRPLVVYIGDSVTWLDAWLKISSSQVWIPWRLFGNNLEQVVYTLYASVTKQYKVVPVKG